jgi:hypothetical protein
MRKNSLRIVLAGLAVLLSSSFCILTPRPALEFSPDQMPAAKVGQPYQEDITIARNVTPVGFFSIKDGALPPGLKLTSERGQPTGRISGSPSQAGTYTFTVSVYCLGTNVAGQTGDMHYTLVVGE